MLKIQQGLKEYKHQRTSYHLIGGLNSFLDSDSLGSDRSSISNLDPAEAAFNAFF